MHWKTFAPLVPLFAVLAACQHAPPPLPPAPSIVLSEPMTEVLASTNVAKTSDPDFDKWRAWTSEDLRSLRVADEPPKKCGGIERWPVKVGTDDEAGEIDLAEEPTDLKIEALNRVTPEKIKEDDPRRTISTLSEKKLYRVRGYLRFWKLEKPSVKDKEDPPDGDYHVVLVAHRKDGFNHYRENPTDLSLIVEFPNERCVGGQEGSKKKSAFVSSKATGADLDLAVARSMFEGLIAKITAQRPKLPKCTPNHCELTPKNAVYLEVIGVGFFDFPHGQIGRARNAFEIHPVLSVRPIEGGEPIS